MALQNMIFTAGSADYGSASNGYVLQLTLTEEAVDVAANTSLVGYDLRLCAGGSNRFDWELTATLELAGVRVAQVTQERFLDYYGQWQLLSGTVTVPHGEDGSLNMTCLARLTPYAGGNRYTPPAMTLTENMPLTQIPRASTVSASAAVIGGISQITVERKCDGFTHSLHYSFGALEGYLTPEGSCTEERLFSDTRVAFTLGEEFYTQIPDSPDGNCILTVCTYLDGLLIGQPQTGVLRVNTDRAVCEPGLQVFVLDSNAKTAALTGDPGRLVRHASHAECHIAVRTRHGAGLAEVRLSNGLLSLEDWRSSPCEEGMLWEGVVTVEQVDAALRFTATDSRGYSVSLTTAAPEVAYIPISCMGSICRSEPTSLQATLTLAGTFYDGCFDAAMQNRNGLQIRCEVGGSTYLPEFTTDGSSYELKAVLDGLSYSTAYTVTVTLEDRVSTLVKKLRLMPGIPVFDWGEKDFAFHVPVTAPAINDRGSCANPDQASEPGCYRLTAASPVGEGLLAVCSAAGAQLQLAVSKDGSTRKWRLRWDGAYGSWND